MGILDLFFPKRCVGCGRIGRYFCVRCLPTIRLIESQEAICPVCEKPAIDGATHPRCQTRYSLDGLTSLFHYHGVVRQAIKSLKYRYVSDLAQEFIDLVPSSSLDRIPKSLSSNPLSSLCIPVPLHSSRERFRGFNQADVLGKLLSERLGIQVNAALRRVKKTTPQVEMKDRQKRLTNMTDVFALTECFDKRVPKHQFVKDFVRGVILFDDVFTTGATMRAAGSVLKRAGIPSVWAVTMAR